ncbi:methyltransferase domain-containing protein [Arhodomonas sp. SL1]|uniref:methyltransferase domain-containing protein n=1 Tax=Arhodomonas sp. SL1 TaxID=3425691 RepID=UPI003F881211
MTPLHETRLEHVHRCIKATGARRVLDLGCGSGALMHRLARDRQFEEVVGLEASGQALAQARAALSDFLNGATGVRLARGSYAEPQPSLTGYEAAAMVETIEHVHPGDLSRVEECVFGRIRPGWLFMTTPNGEYNPLLGLGPGEFREPDHCFEWDRTRFRRWARGVARRNGYRVSFSGIGEQDPELGPPTQMATFRHLDADSAKEQ